MILCSEFLGLLVGPAGGTSATLLKTGSPFFTSVPIPRCFRSAFFHASEGEEPYQDGTDSFFNHSSLPLPPFYVSWIFPLSSAGNVPPHHVPAKTDSPAMGSSFPLLIFRPMRFFLFPPPSSTSSEDDASFFFPPTRGFPISRHVFQPREAHLHALWICGTSRPFLPAHIRLVLFLSSGGQPRLGGAELTLSALEKTFLVCPLLLFRPWNAPSPPFPSLFLGRVRRELETARLIRLFSPRLDFF